MMNVNAIIKAISNNSRWMILQLLKRPEKHFRGQKTDIQEYGVCNGSIQDKLKLSQSTTSHYLKILEQCDLIISKRLGQWTYYKRNEKVINEFKLYIKNNL